MRKSTTWYGVLLLESTVKPTISLQRPKTNMKNVLNWGTTKPFCLIPEVDCGANVTLGLQRFSLTEIISNLFGKHTWDKDTERKM